MEVLMTGKEGYLLSLIITPLLPNLNQIYQYLHSLFHIPHSYPFFFAVYALHACKYIGKFGSGLGEEE